MEFKKCRSVEDGGCGEVKEVHHFRLHGPKHKGYRLPMCIECLKKSQKEWAKKTKQKPKKEAEDWSFLYKPVMTIERN